MSILLYGCTTWTLTKRLEKKLDGNYTRMLRAILNKSRQQHSTRRQLYGHLPSITKTIQARRTRHAGHCWRSKDELVSDVLLWTPAYGQSKAGRPARTYIQQLCDDTGCNPEDLPETMNDRETWRERVRDIRTSRTTWWWWLNGLVRWGCRIHRLRPCRSIRLPQRVSWYESKQSVMLEISGMERTPLLPSLPGLLWPGVVAPDRLISMGPIELNCVFILNWIVWNRAVLTFKLCTYAKLNGFYI